MLSLDSPRWGELAQAYGPAEDIPRLLAALGAVETERERAELWFALWSLLCPEDRVFTASYAAAPHVLAAAGERLALRERAQAAQLVACIEANRHNESAPKVPADLLAAYAAAVERLPAIVCACAAEPWDAQVARVLAGALLVGKRHPRLGRGVMEGERDGGMAG